MPNRPAIASMSIGSPGVHGLPSKLRQAAKHGFEGIEMFFEDIRCFAEGNGVTLIEATRDIRHICDSLHLQVVCLQPFLFYEGLIDRAEHSKQLQEKLPLWFKLARVLKTDLIQVPSNFLGPDPKSGATRTTGDLNLIVSDLCELADMGLKQNPPIRFAYEAIAWADHVYTWETAWDIVCRVDRPNFGICLDTFNLAGRVFADPTSVSGKTPNADIDIYASIDRLRSKIDAQKIFFIQIVDGERLSSPLIPGHPFYVANQPSRMSWSRNARLFPFEQDRGGYLPVLEVSQAFFDTGFEGWVSFELFSRTLADPDPKTPENHCKRGIKSWRKLNQELDMPISRTQSISPLKCSEPSISRPYLSPIVANHKM